MGKEVDLAINGDFHRGFAVNLKIRQHGDYIAGDIGKLPPYPELREHYNHWQALYRNLDEVLKTLPLKRNAIPTNSSDALPACQKAADLLKSKFQQWLRSAEFSPIETTFRNALSPEEDIWVLLETDNPQLLRFPWNLWGLRADFPKTEIGVASPSFRAVGNPSAPKDKVKILAILGDEIGSADVEALKRVSDCEVKWLVQPQPEDLDGPLWEEQWDMLFFAGHSWSLDDDRKGEFQLSRQVSLSISDLRIHLQKAIGQGLQLAIFNSCDGLGLAYQLAAGEDLHLPYTIVMRENLPKQVAPKWLDYFVQEFTRGKSLPGAVGEARKRLQSLEPIFPCASWLPVICQNQTAAPLTWDTLRGMESGIKWREVCQEALAKQRRLTTNPLTAGDGLEFEVNDVYVPLGLMERKKLPKPQSDVSPERGSQLYQEKKAEEKEGEHEVTRIFRNDEFFEEVLGRGVSPKSGGRRLGIIGEPGSGKTTLLQKIADWVLKSSPQDVAIWVSLADLQSRSLEDYLLQKWLKDALGVARVTPEREDALVELFHSGRVWLLLDGVDEMSEANPLQVVASGISGWVAKGRVVVSCRLNVWDAGKNYLEGFDVYRNLDFDWEQVGQFIGCWFARNPEKAAKLGAALEEAGKERIRDAVKNPLRLALLCWTWQQREASLPPTQALLYQQFAEVLYAWKQEAFPTTSQQQRELNGALGRLALKALDESSSRFRLRKQWVRECLGERDAPLCQLALQLGWLNIVGVAAENPSEEVYGFFHATFQEYFAAVAVEDWHFFLNHVPDNPRKGTYRIFQPQWKQVILLWLGREDVAQHEKEEFIQSLVNFRDGWHGFYECQAFCLAAAGIVEFDCSMTDYIVIKLVDWSFGYYNEKKEKWVRFYPQKQEAARAALQETKREAVINDLAEVMSICKEEGIRRDVARMLREIAPEGDRRVIQTLVCALLQFGFRGHGLITRRHGKSLIMILKEIVTEDKITEIATFTIEEILGGSMEQEIRENAYHLLTEIAPEGDRKVIAALLELLRTTNDKETSCQGAELLIKIAPEGDKTTIAALKELLHTCPNEFTRGAVTYSLRKIDPGNQAEIGAEIFLKKQDTSADLMQLWPTSKYGYTVSSDEDTRAAILREISVGNQDQIANLIQVVRTTSDYKSRCKAANILGEIAVGNKYFIAEMLELLRTESDMETRGDAAEILVKIAVGNKYAIAVLNEHISTCSDEDTRLVVADTLAKIEPGNQKAIATLVELLLTGSDEETRYLAARNIDYIAQENQEAISQENITTLIETLWTSSDKETRERSADILGNIAEGGNKEAIAVLIEWICNCSDEQYDRGYSYRLNNICGTNPEVITELIELLRNSSDQKTCNRVAEGLKYLYKVEDIVSPTLVGNKNAIAAFIEILRNDSKSERAAIILSKIVVGSQEAISLLIELLLYNPPDEDVYKLVEEILEKIAVDNQEAIDMLLELLHPSLDLNIRIRAANVLEKIAVGNQKAIGVLSELLATSVDEWTRAVVASSLSYIDRGNPRAIEVLSELLETCVDEYLCCEIAYNLLKIDPDNQEDAIKKALINLFRNSANEEIRNNAAEILREIRYIRQNLEIYTELLRTYPKRHFFYTISKALVKHLLPKEGDLYLDTVRGLKDALYKDKYCYEVLWHCAQNLSYPDFHEAFNDRLIVPPSLQQEQIASILAQLQPTDKTYPLPLDAESLAEETDPQAIPQEFCNLIYQATCPSEDIPENIDSAAKLKPKIQRIKKGLPKPQLAIILYNCEPSDELIKFCRKLRNMLHIGWVTEAQLEPPLRGFPANQADLLSAMRSWLQEIG